MQPAQPERIIVTTQHSRKIDEIRFHWALGYRIVSEHDLPKGKVSLVFEKILVKEPQQPSEKMKDRFKQVKKELEK